MSDSPMFSVVLPTWNRYRKLQRALNSLAIQTYQDFEVVVVDDGSADPVEGIVAKYDFDSDEGLFRCITMKHKGRVHARNAGMEAAEGDWICWLDSDDAYDIEYLNTVRYNIKQEPEARLWVVGAVVHGVHKDSKDPMAANVGEDRDHVCPRWTKLREAWIPPLNPGGETHKHFPSGKVGTGMFVFHRECLDKTGLLPPWINHKQVADGVDEWLGYETGYSYAKKWVGNPWGDDWAMFRKLTMFYRAYPIPVCLYVHYVR